MRYEAYQIVDLNNPISVKYSEISRKSFEPVSHIIKINPVQCFVPGNLPQEISWNNKKKRSETEKAVVASHYRLANKCIFEEERIIIMEHDAYLRPDLVKRFIKLLDYIPTCDVWNVGIAMECYSINFRIAEKYCEIVDNDFIYSQKGPMGILHKAAEMVDRVKVLWPVDRRIHKDVLNRTCLSSSIKKASNMKGSKIYHTPVTQVVSENVGVTIERKWKPNSKDNPDVHFITL